jgi:alkylation response protein AidB-like acyl-CoA dehydrogenase
LEGCGCAAVRNFRAKPASLLLLPAFFRTDWRCRGFVCAAKSGGKPPTIQSSQYKLFTTSLSQRVCKDALDIQGHEGTLMEGQDDAPLRGRFEGAYRATMNETVGGGSSEIQKNIIARRHLGLPKNF